MTPLESYILFTTLKLHFTTESYDYHKYHGKLKKAPKFENVKDKYVFAKLSKHNDLKGLIIANLINNPKLWARDLTNSDAQKQYLKWLGYKEAQHYYFKEEMNLLNKDSFKIIDHQHPEALKLFLKKVISINTLVIADSFIKFIDHWDNVLKDDPVWASVDLTIKKYRSFIDYDKTKAKDTLKNWLDIHR